MNSIRNKYKEVTDYGNLKEAYRKARLCKRNKTEVLMFEEDLGFSIMLLKTQLETHEYKVGDYRSFKVYEPKEREIKALPFRDRVVQHSLCDNVLEPFLEKRLDYDNAACRKGKGTHFALNRLKTFMKKAYNKWGSDYYVLKCDIRKYFYSIDRKILKKELYRYISDKEIIWLLDEIIDSAPGEKGVPIGNMTSQWFAVFYLDGMDRFIRNELKIRFYSRYMDDFVLIHKDKEYLKECKNRLEEWLIRERRLELNEKTQIFPIKNGVDYLGFHSYLTETGKVIRKIRRKSKRNMLRKVKRFKKAYARDEIELEKVKQSLMAWTGHAKHGNTYNLRKKIQRELVLTRNDNKLVLKKEIRKP